MENLENIHEIVKQIDSLDESKLLDLLAQLKPIQITYEILKETKIGIAVRRLETKFPAFKTQIQDLINSWREIVRQSKSPQINPPDLKEPRRKVLTLLTELLKSPQVSIEIEAELNKLSPKAYVSKFRSLKHNLSKNQEIREQVSSGVISAEEIVKMDFKDKNNELITNPNKNLKNPQKEEIKSNWTQFDYLSQPIIYKCSKCDSDKIIIHEFPTRSCDVIFTK